MKFQKVSYKLYISGQIEGRDNNGFIDFAQLGFREIQSDTSFLNIVIHADEWSFQIDEEESRSNLWNFRGKPSR